IQTLAKRPAGTFKSGCRFENWWPFFSFGDKANTSGCTHAFVARFVIRQMGDSSAAVKPPSFNPYYEWTTYQLSLGGNANAAVTARPGLLQYWRLKLAHYSNGQAGCTYSGDVWVGKDSACTRPDSIKSDVLNTNDGDFSTSYAELGWAFGFFRIGDDY